MLWDEMAYFDDESSKWRVAQWKMEEQVNFLKPTYQFKKRPDVDIPSQAFFIRHSPLAIRHSSLVTRHSQLALPLHEIHTDFALAFGCYLSSVGVAEQILGEVVG